MKNLLIISMTLFSFNSMASFDQCQEVTKNIMEIDKEYFEKVTQNTNYNPEVARRLESKFSNLKKVCAQVCKEHVRYYDFCTVEHDILEF